MILLLFLLCQVLIWQQKQYTPYYDISVFVMPANFSAHFSFSCFAAHLLSAAHKPHLQYTMPPPVRTRRRKFSCYAAAMWCLEWRMHYFYQATSSFIYKVNFLLRDIDDACSISCQLTLPLLHWYDRATLPRPAMPAHFADMLQYAHLHYAICHYSISLSTFLSATTWRRGRHYYMLIWGAHSRHLKKKRWYYWCCCVHAVLVAIATLRAVLLFCYILTVFPFYAASGATPSYKIEGILISDIFTPWSADDARWCTHDTPWFRNY